MTTLTTSPTTMNPIVNPRAAAALTVARLLAGALGHEWSGYSLHSTEDGRLAASPEAIASLVEGARGPYVTPGIRSPLANECPGGWHYTHRSAGGGIVWDATPDGVSVQIERPHPGREGEGAEGIPVLYAWFDIAEDGRLVLSDLDGPQSPNFVPLSGTEETTARRPAERRHWHEFSRLVDAIYEADEVLADPLAYVLHQTSAAEFEPEWPEPTVLAALDLALVRSRWCPVAQPISTARWGAILTERGMEPVVAHSVAAGYPAGLFSPVG